MVERDDRPVVGTFFVDAPPRAGARLPLSDAAAHHARVKRLDVGHRVRLTDGSGTLASGTLAEVRKNAVEVAVEGVETFPPQPAIHLRVPIGDRDRMLWLAEKATELGVTSWQGVRFHRSLSVSPRGEGSAFAEKVRGRMIAALEQSGGAWLPRLLPDATWESVVAPADADRILLDAGGAPLRLQRADSARREPVVMFGPEGGVAAEERAALLAAGWRTASLASTTLRFETAGMAAVAVIRVAQMSWES